MRYLTMFMKGEKYTFLSATVPYDRVYLQGNYHPEVQEKLDALLEQFLKARKPSEYRIINVSVLHLGSDTDGVPVSPGIEYLVHIGYIV